MTLKEYDRAIERICRMRLNAQEIIKDADNFDAWLLRVCGIEHVSRDPGFPCWRHKNLPGYYHHPREVMEELEKVKT